MNKRILTTLISAALTAGAVSAASAQTAAPAPGAQAPARVHHSHGKRAFSLPGERVEARLAYVKTALKVTPAQEPQWNAFANTVRKQASARDERIKAARVKFADGKPRERPNAIARMEWQQKRHAEAAARLDELLAVERPFYAALTPEQQQVADEVLAQHHGHGGFGRHGGHGRA